MSMLLNSIEELKSSHAVSRIGIVWQVSINRKPGLRLVQLLALLLWLCVYRCEYRAFRLTFAGACWDLLMPTVSTWLPIFSMLSACYCLDRHYVLKLLATSTYDEG